MKVLVAGAGGELGAVVVKRFRDRADVVALTKTDLDITDAGAIAALVARERPDAIVNCAAYNDVDGAEDHPREALRINAIGVRALAAAAARSGATLVHYSTDFVFAGTADRVHTEGDEPNPQNSYGLSKLLGESFAADVPRHYVLRVASLFGGSRRISRIDRIAEALRRGEPTPVFVDRTVTPSYVPDVTEATWRLIAENAPSGLYHCVSSGATTWAGLASAIATHLGAAATDVVPVRVGDVPGRVHRPQYAALSNDKLARAGITMPPWQAAVRRHLDALRGALTSPGEHAR